MQMWDTKTKGVFQVIKILRVILSILLCATLFPVAALAEACFLINVDTLEMQRLNDGDYVRQYLSGQSQGVRIQKFISDSSEFAARVRLTITQAETSTIVYDKNYGYVSGVFDSGDIYLPFVDNNTIPYLITLNIEDWTYALPYMQMRARLSHNSGCTYGLRLRDINPSLPDGWIMGTMLDLDALRQTGGTVLPVCASNQYIVGHASVSVSGDQLSVNVSFLPEANVELHRSSVYLLPHVAELTALDPGELSLPRYELGQSIQIGGLQTALLYMPMTLSFDATAMGEFFYDAGGADISQQWQLWQNNLAMAQTTDGAMLWPTEVPAMEAQPDPGTGQEGIVPEVTLPEDTAGDPWLTDGNGEQPLTESNQWDMTAPLVLP